MLARDVIDDYVSTLPDNHRAVYARWSDLDPADPPLTPAAAWKAVMRALAADTLEQWQWHLMPAVWYMRNHDVLVGDSARWVFTHARASHMHAMKAYRVAMAGAVAIASVETPPLPLVPPMITVTRASPRRAENRP